MEEKAGGHQIALQPHLVVRLRFLFLAAFCRRGDWFESWGGLTAEYQQSFVVHICHGNWKLKKLVCFHTFNISIWFELDIIYKEPETEWEKLGTEDPSGEAEWCHVLATFLRWERKTTTKKTNVFFLFPLIHGMTLQETDQLSQKYSRGLREKQQRWAGHQTTIWRLTALYGQIAHVKPDPVNSPGVVETPALHIHLPCPKGRRAHA